MITDMIRATLGGNVVSQMMHLSFGYGNPANPAAIDPAGNGITNM